VYAISDLSVFSLTAFYAGNWACFEAESQEDVEVCIMALEKMRWAFSSGEARIATLRFAWANRHSADNTAGGWSNARASPEGRPLRDPGLITEMHLPIGLGQIVGVGQDAFEHYVYEKAVNTFADDGLSSSKSFHSSANQSNDYSHVVSSSVYHTPPESFQLAPLENLDHVNGTTSTSPYGRDDSPWDPLHQTVSSMPNGVATSRHRRSSSARSFGGVGDAGGSPHTPSVGGSSYSGPSSFPLTPDPSHPPAAFFGLPQPAPQQSQSSSSWFNRGAVAHQRHESEPSWLSSSASPFPSPSSQSQHHSQQYGGTLTHDSHLYDTDPQQQPQQQQHVPSFSSAYALPDTPIPRHQPDPTTTSSRNVDQNNRRDYTYVTGVSLPSLSSSTPNLRELNAWSSTGTGTGFHHLRGSPSSDGSVSSTHPGSSSYNSNGYVHPSHPQQQQHSFHHQHSRGSLKHHASLDDETQLVNPTRYPTEFSHLDTPWHR
jgi:hypothetical protein